MNKIPLLFLESCVSPDYPAEMMASLESYRARWRRTLQSAIDLEEWLGRKGVDFAIFKTLKPFPTTSADIDVLFRSQEDLRTAVDVFGGKGYDILESDAYGMTMHSVDKDMNIDFTTEVAVSGLVYIDKNVLLDNATNVTVDGCRLTTLKPSADLVVTAAHAFFKEQMLTLADYYTIILSSQEIAEAMNLAARVHISHPMRLIIELAHDVTARVFESADNILGELQKASNDGHEVIGTQLRFPFKFSPRIMLWGLARKVMEDPKTQHSLSSAFGTILRWKFAKDIIEHAARSGY